MTTLRQNSKHAGKQLTSKEEAELQVLESIETQDEFVQWLVAFKRQQVLDREDLKSDDEILDELRLARS